MSLQELKLEGDVIALEAVSGETALISALSRLPSYLEKTKTAFQEQFDRTMRTVLDFAASFQAATRRLRRLDYGKYRECKVQVPAGLKTDLLTYVKALDEATEQVSRLDRDVIAPFLAWTISNLGRPEELRSLTGGVVVAGYKPISVESINKSLTACFHEKGRQEAMVPYGQAVKRSADWEQVESHIANIRRNLTPALQKNVQAQVSDLAIALETMIVRLTKSPEKYNPNAKVLKEIVDTSYAVAEAIELYGIIRFRYQELEHSIEKLNKDLQ